MASFNSIILCWTFFFRCSNLLSWNCSKLSSALDGGSVSPCLSGSGAREGGVCLCKIVSSHRRIVNNNCDLASKLACRGVVCDDRRWFAYGAHLDLVNVARWICVDLAAFFFVGVCWHGAWPRTFTWASLLWIVRVLVSVVHVWCLQLNWSFAGCCVFIFLALTWPPFWHRS